MMAAYDRSGKAIILTIASAIILICPFVSGGFFNIDEFVYFIGADGFYRTGGLTVENGIDGVTSDDLRILLLVAGPDGLAPQYPAGTAIAGGYLIGLFGQYALIALNVLAGIGTLFAAHALACRLFFLRLVRLDELVPLHSDLRRWLHFQKQGLSRLQPGCHHGEFKLRPR